MKQTLEPKINKLLVSGIIDELLSKKIKEINKKPDLSNEMSTDLYKKQCSVYSILNKAIIIDVDKYIVLVYLYAPNAKNKDHLFDLEIKKIKEKNDFEAYINKYDSYILADYLQSNVKIQKEILRHPKVKDLYKIFKKEKKKFNALVKKISNAYTFNKERFIIP